MSDDEEAVDTVYVIDEEMKGKIDRIYDALWIGNGKPSLMTRMAALEGKMQIIVWVGTAVGLLIIGFLFSLLTHQVSVGP